MAQQTPQQQQPAQQHQGRRQLTPVVMTTTTTSTVGRMSTFTTTAASPTTTHGSSHFVAGAVAGTVAAVVMCPLEVLKIRMQAGALSSAGRAATGATAARTGFQGWSVISQLGRVARTEGVRGLWRGASVNVAGVGATRSMYFGVYDKARNVLASNGINSKMVHMSAASAAGLATSTLLSPLWVIKTRLQIQTNKDAVLQGGARLRNYRGPLDAARCIMREEGPKAFWKGLSATYLGVTEGAIQFMMYQEMKAYARQRDWALNPLSLFSFAAVAKLVATTITYPHEVLRTRLRDRRMLLAPGGPKYTGLRQCFRRIIAEEGAGALYHGLGPHLARVVPNAALIFLLVEWCVGGNM